MAKKDTRFNSTSPCRSACPAGVDIPQYVRLIKAGDFAGALDVIRLSIPFPLICGFACAHPCEAQCARAQFDDPVAIRRLKRLAAEQDDRTPEAITGPRTGKKVAVIGAGPCGLSAAYYLNLLGHSVAVFDAQPQAGGMLRYCIPAYRLPDEVVSREISLLQRAGVELHGATRVASPRALLAGGFDAVFVATGAWTPSRMGIEGEDLPTVIDGLQFLQQLKLGEKPAIGPRVIVVGGGNTAIDAARAAVRLGATVEIVYRRSRAEMPADAEEIEEALEEGVTLKALTLPLKIEDGSVTCVAMRLQGFDADGRGIPEPVAGSEHVRTFDTLIMAVGQSADAAALALEEDRKGRAVVAGESLATSLAGIFAGGDLVTGPANIVEAIAQGRRASEAIDRYLGGAGVLPEAGLAEQEGDLAETAPRGSAQLAAEKLDLDRRRTSFEVVEQSYQADQAVAEAARCLSCDLREFDVIINGALCKDCGYCREICRLGVIGQDDEFNAQGFRPARARDGEKCIGCLRCLYICPDFAITVKQRCKP